MSIAEVVGYVVIAGLWIMMAAASVAAACAAVQMLLNRHANSVAAKTRREIGNALLSDAWWFGEDRGAQEVLRMYGRTMAEGYGTDPNQIRERWRTAIASEKDRYKARLAEAERDAARYRWLRRGNYSIETARSILNDTAEGIDAAIDTAMEQSQ